MSNRLPPLVTSVAVYLTLLALPHMFRLLLERKPMSACANEKQWLSSSPETTRHTGSAALCLPSGPAPVSRQMVSGGCMLRTEYLCPPNPLAGTNPHGDGVRRGPSGGG